MAVYVDDFKAPYRGMLMSHMMADTSEELLDMIDKIGGQRKWIQYPNTSLEHFDVCQTKKKLAIQFGAKPISRRELVDFRAKKKQQFGVKSNV